MGGRRINLVGQQLAQTSFPNFQADGEGRISPSAREV